MTLAVVGTLSTNKHSIKQKETNKKNTQFQHDVIRDNKYGNGFCVNFIESEAQKRVSGIRKKKHVIVVSEDTKSIKSRQKSIPARNSHITSALNLITFYMHICA